MGGASFHVGITDVLASGGATLFFLIGLSIYSFALILERWKYYQKSMSGQNGFLDKVRQALETGDLSNAVTLARGHKGLAGPVVMASLVGPTNREERKRGALRAAERGVSQLQKRISFLGTIASTAPFIGLFGTVVGVMRAFRDLAGAAGAGPGVVAIGISEALVCTATGLLVAIPAVWAYNYFNSRSAAFAEEMNWISEEVLERLSEKAHR